MVTCSYEQDVLEDKVKFETKSLTNLQITRYDLLWARFFCAASDESELKSWTYIPELCQQNILIGRSYEKNGKLDEYSIRAERFHRLHHDFQNLSWSFDIDVGFAEKPFSSNIYLPLKALLFEQ